MPVHYTTWGKQQMYNVQLIIRPCLDSNELDYNRYFYQEYYHCKLNLQFYE